MLLLCVNPGFSYQKPTVSPETRDKELRKKYTDIDVNISVDGGVGDDILPELSNLGVTIAVQGGAIFGSS